MQKPELVAPAGDLAMLSSAVANGADAVYFGVKGFSLRNFARNFEISQVPDIMRRLHAQGKRGYLALNVFVREVELGRIDTIVRQAAAAGVDAVICWDLAVVRQARQAGLRVHLSTQAGASNSAALAEYAALGVSRAVLARECTLAEIRRITAGVRQAGALIDTEVFIHGAMCVSVSGRCLLSALTAAQSANRGECLQYCRRNYRIVDEQDGVSYELGRDYVLSARDLCTIGFLEQIIASGVQAVKIEGRMRQPEYAATVTQVYRQAIDACADGRWDAAAKAAGLSRLRQVALREFSSGFYWGRAEQVPAGPVAPPVRKSYVGRVEKYYARVGVAEVLVHQGRVRPGQRLLISGPRTPVVELTVERIEQEHRSVESAGRGERVGIKVPAAVRTADKVFALDTPDNGGSGNGEGSEGGGGVVAAGGDSR